MDGVFNKVKNRRLHLWVQLSIRVPFPCAPPIDPCREGTKGVVEPDPWPDRRRSSVRAVLGGSPAFNCVSQLVRPAAFLASRRDRRVTRLLQMCATYPAATRSLLYPASRRRREPFPQRE
jgi:hypothetical protein